MNKSKVAGQEVNLFGKRFTVRKNVIFPVLSLLLCVNAAFAQKGEISGDLKTWHKVTITFNGPATSESAALNPFMNFRLDVTFTHTASGTTLVVPGYWAADGDAANTSATEGNKWRVHLSPSETGTWNYKVSFLKGTDVHFNKSVGTSAEFMDGETGSFEIGSTDKVHPDMRSKGWLQWVGGHYPQFKGNKEYMMKMGVDGPETLLGYTDFDNTTPKTHDYLPHVTDWKTGDPSWANGKGKGLIGMINYLASEEQNAMGCIINQAPNGDAQAPAYPYIDKTDMTRLDVSKVTQWAIVFDHGTKMGMFWHFKLSETENECAQDKCDVGRERTMYFRECIARFGYNPALCWNLGEENGVFGPPDQNTTQRRAMAQYFWDNDPYRHLVVLHNGMQPDDMYGDQSKLTGWSLQKATFTDGPNAIRAIVQKSAQTGRPWAVSGDELGGNSGGIVKDASNPAHDLGRKYMVWGTIMVGGWGAEMYLRNSDWLCNEFHTRDKWWDFPRYTLQFFRNNHIPFWEMKNNDALTSSATDWVLAKEGKVYVIYLREGGTSTLNVGSSNVNLKVKWYNPRAGGALQDGSVTDISGSGNQSIGNPPIPADLAKDWVVLVGVNNITTVTPLKKSISGIVMPTFVYYSGTDNKVNGIISKIPNGSNAEITIVDVHGRSILNRSFAKIDKGELRFTLNASAIPFGLHLVNCRVGNKTYCYKMMLKS